MNKPTVGVVALACVAFAGHAFAQDNASARRYAPSPLLQVDQHRQSIVDGIAATWRDALAQHTGGVVAAEEAKLRAALMGLRADKLLAASLAGSYATVEALLAESQAEASTAQRAALKNLGDAGADLTYTPVNPCRILDTRAAGGPLAANTGRTFDGYNASSFAFQGGTATSCGMPNGVAAIAMNVYAVNPTNLGFIKLWPANGAEPAVSTVNYQVGITAIATGAIVPVDGASSNRFIAKSPAVVDFVADVVGYFKAPSAPVGTVSNIATGIGLTGGPITTTGSISIANGGVGTAEMSNGSVTKSKIAAAGGGAGQVLGTDGSNLLWQNMSATNYVTVAVNYSVSTDVYCPSGYRAIAASCQPQQVVLQSQTPSPPGGVWSSYLIPSASAAIGVHCNIGAGMAQALLRCSN